MPGFNQRGPMNEGPMTGRGSGRCTGAVDPVQEFSGRQNTMGMGRQRGWRGCQEGFGPRGGTGFGQRATAAPAAASDTQANLQNSVDMLAAELAAIKKQLKNLSESRE